MKIRIYSISPVKMRQDALELISRYNINWDAVIVEAEYQSSIGERAMIKTLKKRKNTEKKQACNLMLLH